MRIATEENREESSDAALTFNLLRQKNDADLRSKSNERASNWQSQLDAFSMKFPQFFSRTSSHSSFPVPDAAIDISQPGLSLKAVPFSFAQPQPVPRSQKRTFKLDLV